MRKQEPMLILIAGPYRSGTGGDTARMAQNLERLEASALRVYEAGHVPLIGEWLALPLARQAGSKAAGDEVAERYLYPTAHRLLERCDAVLRIEGESRGADEDVRRARARGLPVYFHTAEVPAAVCGACR
ncbi:MAG: DUF4406 domain-containing protein [Terracidiphilus sp.]|nr:DUF4406 domain-containing protein [Terracidiphilus sp.]